MNSIYTRMYCLKMDSGKMARRARSRLAVLRHDLRYSTRTRTFPQRSAAQSPATGKFPIATILNCTCFIRPFQTPFIPPGWIGPPPPGVFLPPGPPPPPIHGHPPMLSLPPPPSGPPVFPQHGMPYSSSTLHSARSSRIGGKKQTSNGY